MKNNWISVKTALPKDNNEATLFGKVLIYWREKKNHIQIIDANSVKQCHEDTFWMRIPLDLPLPPLSNVYEDNKNTITVLKAAMDKLTDNERLELIGNYCKYCGSTDSGCQCWNDD